MANPNPNTKGLIKYKKGQTGNPNGRPSIVNNIKNYIREALSEKIPGSDTTKLEVLTQKLLYMAGKGNMKALELVMAYGYGKPQQNVDVTTNGESMQSVLIVPESVANSLLKDLPANGMDDGGQKDK